ncbi:MAG: SMI1/KNR4 family protein [Armatimonas sp.]
MLLESPLSQPCSPATEQEIALFVQTVFAPLNSEEQREAAEYDQYMGEIDPSYSGFCLSRWQFPIYPLPESYLNFLQFSNGGFFEGKNRFLNLFKTSEVREMMLGYGVPYWMPNVCTIGFDGGGNLYLFDMRLPQVNGDYPIWLVHAGDMNFEDAQQIASSFTEFINTALGD